MNYIFKPKTDLEKFGLKVYNALVENFHRTYFVGGTVRDFLLGKKIRDIDIATSATPIEAVETLKKYFFDYNLGYQSMGVIIATDNSHTATVTTLRKDLQSTSRYPKIQFVKTAKDDAQRRDFTINSLYLSVKTGKILDFCNGLKDLKNKKIKFIGQTEKRIKQDPLRIIRALRFALQLGFKLDLLAKNAIKKHFYLVKQLTKSKTEKELGKLQTLSHQKIVGGILDNPKLLDKYF